MLSWVTLLIQKKQKDKEVFPEKRWTTKRKGNKFLIIIVLNQSYFLKTRIRMAAIFLWCHESYSVNYPRVNYWQHYSFRNPKWTFLNVFQSEAIMWHSAYLMFVPAAVIMSVTQTDTDN